MIPNQKDSATKRKQSLNALGVFCVLLMSAFFVFNVSLLAFAQDEGSGGLPNLESEDVDGENTEVFDSEGLEGDIDVSAQDLPVSDGAGESVQEPVDVFVDPTQFSETTDASAGVPEERTPTRFQKQTLNPNSIPSVLFTSFEYDALRAARESVGSTVARPATQLELRRDDVLEDGDGEGNVRRKPPPEERYISLAGIVYTGSDDWTIWLNGQRVTPEALPREVLDLRVHREHIEIKWFDDFTRGIFPIRLRPHQRFNLDTRIFLPG